MALGWLVARNNHQPGCSSTAEKRAASNVAKVAGIVVVRADSAAAAEGAGCLTSIRCMRATRPTADATTAATSSAAQ